MLKTMKSRMKSLWSASQTNGMKKVVNQFKNSALIFSFLMIFSWQPIAHAQEVDIATLTPIINFLLDEQGEDDIQCPSFGFEPNIIIEDGVLVSFQSAEGQTIEGDVFITSQQRLDQLSGVTRINGDLILDSQFLMFSDSGLVFGTESSIEADLSPLNSLLEVTGSVTVRTGNTNFDAFNCLRSVGGELNIQGSENIENIAGFKSLESVGGSLVLIVNEVLEKIDGFDSLVSIGIDLQIVGNDRLQSIAGFRSLEFVGNSLFVSSNSALQNVSGFKALGSVGRDLQIAFNSGLELISGFQQLVSIGNNFNIFNNDTLRSISGFSLLETVGFNLNLSSNSNLEGIGSLAALERDDVSGNITIIFNDVFDCGLPVPNFAVATSSSGNAVDCPQDLDSRRVFFTKNESAEIPDLGSVSSSITILAQPNTVGTVRSLEVELDIEHTSVGDLTVTLSNGITTINLLERPAAMDVDVLVGISSECVEDQFPESGFLDEAIGGGIVINVDGFEDFATFDIDCLVDVFRTPDDSISEDVINKIVAQCAGDLFLEDDFLNEISGSGVINVDDFASFPTIDSGCVLEALANLEEEVDGSRVCRSNNISVRLFDHTPSFPINTSCATGDLTEAYPLPAYSPLQPLSAFEGSIVNGTWTLTVTDSEGDNVGVLNSWGVVFNIDR